MNIGRSNSGLGLNNKKDKVKRLITENKIDILCLKETELESNYPTNILSFKGFNFGATFNTEKV